MVKGREGGRGIFIEVSPLTSTSLCSPPSSLHVPSGEMTHSYCTIYHHH